MLIVFLYSCKEERKEWSDEEAASYADKEYIENVKIIYSDSGNIVIKIKAPLMIRHTKLNEHKEEFPNGFLAEFYDKKMCYKIHSALSMLFGVWKAEPLPCRTVFTLSITGETMHSAELIWDEREGKLYTDKFVRVTRKDEIIQGYGFETDEKFQKSTMKYIDAQIPASKLIKPDVLK
ncbi:MAG: hypothetical protein IPK61_14555 [Saprospiraceae bacterium]|nr:hypothetical protein [Saprospiraceae bacterium]